VKNVVVIAIVKTIVNAQTVNVKRRKIMSNPNWNKDSNAGRNSKGGVKGNWSDRGTISIPNASPKEKEKAVSIAVGTVKGTAQGMGAATKGGKYSWVGPKDSKW
jgi:hypothetical protein